jgi:UrcA family protein
MKFRLTIMTAVAVVGLSAGIATVQADESNAPSQAVSYAGLNLDSDVGARMFYTRVQSAAKSVCSAYGGRDLGLAERYKSCIDNAVGSAVNQANNSKVTALYTRSKSTPMRLFASR